MVIWRIFRIVSKIAHQDSGNIDYLGCRIWSWRDDWVQHRRQIHYRLLDQVLLLEVLSGGWVLLPWILSTLIIYIFYIHFHHKMDKRNPLRLLAPRKGSIQGAYGCWLPFRTNQRAWLWSYISGDWYRFLYRRRYTLSDKKYFHVSHRHLHFEILFRWWLSG